MTQMQQNQQQQANLPGQFFDVPGIGGGSTQWTEQDETTTNLNTVLQSAAQTQAQGIQSFRQTDVVCDWMMVLNVAQTYTAGTSALTASAYAPFNVVGPVRNLVQNQYASVDVESGIDLAIFNILRPYSQAEILTSDNMGANPGGSPVGGTATGYLTTALAQANNMAAAVWSTGATAYNLFLRIPAGQWFDRYYDLAVTGEALTQPHPALVSPQYMAGTTRVITPSVTFAAGNSATTDNGPVNIGAGTGTFAGNVNLRLRRRAIYAGNPATQPPIYAWQYRWKTTRLGIGGRSVADLQLPLDSGQVLGVYVRLFDPAAAGGLGAPININTITRFNLQYGSGLLYVDWQTIGTSTAASLFQRNWFKNHDIFLPPGVVAVDLGMDERQQMSNARALNTLTTAGIVAHLEFTAPVSASAYAVLGIESLVYVT